MQEILIDDPRRAIPREAPPPTRPPMPRHLEVFYKDAVDNMRFLKRQQWVTINYSMAVYTAIYLVGRRVEADPHSWTDVILMLLSLFTLATLCYSIYFTMKAQNDLTILREQITEMWNRYFSPDEINLLKIRTKKKPFHYNMGLLVALCSVSTAAALTVGYFLWVASPAAAPF